jgi:2-polyprenyl-6-methoxyphenol hydroxylase-like FAD-dependent oxidoreductase
MSEAAFPAGDVASCSNTINSNSMAPLPVIIIGGGLAGLSLALGLANLGFRVEIVEKQLNFSRTGATFGLAVNGQKALEELSGPGIVKELKDVGLDVDPPDISTMLGWWNVRDALLDRVMKMKNVINIRHGLLLQDIKDDDDTSVKAVFHKHHELVLEGCMLVGADGVNSTVRSLLGLARAKDTGVLTWRSRVQVPPALREEQGGETCNDETHGTKAQHDAMLSILRPIVESPLKDSFLRVRGPMIYALFNFNEKLPGTMALVVALQQQEGNGEAETANRKKGTSPQAIMEASAENDDERNEIRAILEFTDEDGIQNPTSMKVIEPPKEVSATGWGGKGRVTILGDAAHGTFVFLVQRVVSLLVCLSSFLSQFRLNALLTNAASLNRLRVDSHESSFGARR